MKQAFLPFQGELKVDCFAGGGGIAEAMKRALGIEPDIAINHDRDAILMHGVNHPRTKHYQEDAYEVDPDEATRGLPVGLFHASPDCTDFSQSKGGQPRRKKIRSLSWVVLKWAGKTKPRIITFENVMQILDWAPLVAKRDPETGRVLKLTRAKKLDPVTGRTRLVHEVAAPGERVPVREQFLVADRKRRGWNWRRLVQCLRDMGYVVDWRKLKACDYGAGTSRERLFMVARRDGVAISWPKPTHGKGRGLKPYVTAAESIDFSIDCPSIFTRKKPLATATCRRIAKGIERFVLNCGDPFIVPIANWSNETVHSIRDPLHAITAWPRGGKDAIVVPTLIQTSYGERPGQSPRVPGLHKPLGTAMAEGIKHAVVSAHLTKFRTGAVGSSMDEPVPTICAGGAMKRPAGAAHALGVVTAFMEQAHEALPGRDMRDPLSTIVGKGCTQRVVTAHTAELSPEAEAGALRVAAFLISYYSDGGGQFSNLRKPMGAITTKDRIALVTVKIRGVPYVIVDIGLRMLTAPELFKAQGFPSTYVINRGSNGKPLTKTAQVRMVGNSVSPPPYEHLLLALFGQEEHWRAAA